MTNLDVPIEGSAGEALLAQVGELSSMLKGERVKLPELGKLYARITRALLEAIERGGLTSLRFRAAAQALDLKTPKSRLVSFLGDAPFDPSTH